MKLVVLFFAVSMIAAACSNEASKQSDATGDSLAADSSSNVVLPKGRSSDSLAVPPQTSTDSTGVKKDSSK